MSEVLDVLDKTYVDDWNIKVAPTLLVRCAGCGREYETTQCAHVIARLKACAECHPYRFRARSSLR